MGGGNILPGYPVKNPTPSYWQLPPHPIANHRTTPSIPAHEFDYTIIGSGITGAATAYKLLTLNPTLKIILLESRTAASGASGRNGGHCRAGWWLNFKKYALLHGEDEALRFERLEEQNVRDIADFVAEHGVECDFRHVETADVYVRPEEWAKIVDTVAFREEVRRRRGDEEALNERKVFQGREARELLGMPSIVGAVTYPAHTQNPYLLVCRMLELAVERGLNLQTNTTAEQISKVEDGKVVFEGQTTAARWKTITDRGPVYSKNVVLATNAYTSPLYPELAKTGFIWPARSQVTAIRPQNNISHNPAFQRSAGLNDFGDTGDYFFARQAGEQGEGDILYGGGRWVSPSRERYITDDSTINEDIAVYLKEAAPRFFGRESWGEHSVEVRDWTGITCYTRDDFPLVGEAPGKKGLWCSVGMNGHGMAMAFRSAEALVEMMENGREPDWFPRSFRIARAWEER